MVIPKSALSVEVVSSYGLVDLTNGRTWKKVVNHYIYLISKISEYISLEFYLGPSILGPGFYVPLSYKMDNDLLNWYSVWQ